MNILLADDERMTRLGLMHMLNELYPDEHQYFEAKNGEQVIEIVREIRPEIVFLDIKMPVMNGLLALEKSKAISPATNFIMLTGYAEFEFARLALKNGAFDYLLKPVDISQIQEILAKIKAEEIKSRQQEQDSLSLRASRIFELYLASGLVPDEELTVLSPYQLYLFSLDAPDRSIRGLFYEKILAACDNLHLQMRMDLAAFFLHTGDFCILTGSNYKLQSLHLALSRFIEQEKASVTIYYLSGDSLNNLLKETEKLLEHTCLRCCIGYQQIFPAKRLYSIDYFAETWSFAQLLENLVLSYQAADHISYGAFLASLHRLNQNSAFFSVLNKDCLAGFLSNYFETPAALGSYEGFLCSLPADCKNPSTKRAVDEDVIHKVQLYIRENYMHQISVHTIGELFDLTPNYLSKIFRERTGKKYIDYLTDIRIMAAKKLLKEQPEKTVKDIGSAVGYYSSRHFTKTFQKVTGLLPSEYRDS